MLASLREKQSNNLETQTEIAQKTSFARLRYAQCWEDADILLEALDIQPGDTCLSIASAGDNSLAMLAKSPARVIAIDLNPAQLVCLELRVAAYQTLAHAELLELVGSRPSSRRRELYRRCRTRLSPASQTFWDGRLSEVAAGVGGGGKFERYFALFRRYFLPLIHSPATIETLLAKSSAAERNAFFVEQWNNRRWRLLARLFCSRWVMGHLGRDPSFFDYVEGAVADRLLTRFRHAITTLEPANNPYLQWILTGRHTTALPYALRPENFGSIRANLDRLKWHCQSVEAFLADYPAGAIDCFNLSDIFEYMSEEKYHHLLDRLVAAGRPGGRLAYWNMLVPRTRPQSMARRLQPLPELSARLHQADKAFFYSRFVVEEIL